jgi:hypothetical protein
VFSNWRCNDITVRSLQGFGRYVKKLKSHYILKSCELIYGLITFLVPGFSRFYFFPSRFQFILQMIPNLWVNTNLVSLSPFSQPN